MFRAEWAREILRQCRGAEVPFFMKQMGAAFNDGRFTLRLRNRAGADMAEWPEDLRVREYPVIHIFASCGLGNFGTPTKEQCQEILSNARIKVRLHVLD